MIILGRIALKASAFALMAIFVLGTVSISDALAEEDFEIRYDAFANPLTMLVDDKLVFLTTTTQDDPPSISVQDTKTGSLLYKIYAPHKSLDDEWFGEHMTSVGNNIAASSIFLDPQTDKWTTLVHVFDGETGNLLYTIENPNSDSMFFGYTLKSIGDKLAVYASDTDPNDDIHDNVVHVFDGKDGSLLYTIENPLDIGHFGKSISTINNNFLVHTRQDTHSNLSGIIHAFDADTGNLQYAIEYPHEDIRDIDPYFGGQSIISGDFVIVKSGDEVYIFDGNTGELRHTVDNPVTTNSQLDEILDSIDNPPQDYFVVIIMSLVAVAIAIGFGIVAVRKIRDSK